ncbi:uncharacterized protein LOC126215254 [Schistocerca nitens]|uniref:uncharacterized protein LOC126215254 n=1 Tax=Schistocerca nitens TaxID=7011 RepID=UPI00211875CF|nr:uncharacterized protein LOC126215254 [Schistocerca nitens]
MRLPRLRRRDASVAASPQHQQQSTSASSTTATSTSLLCRLASRLQAGLPPRGMPEELTTSPTDTATSDLNSNHTTEPVGTAGATGTSNGSFAASNASSQDLDFIQDNSDYQWFLDYGYREAPGGHHVSVLSYSEDAGLRHGGPRYDDLARDLDANLAEVDMEDLRTEDIHSILSTLPAMCCADIQAERQGEMYASVSGSMMAKFEFDSSVSPRSSSQAEDTTGSTDTMSICKSEQLFSPVRECPLPGCNFSVDSLDCEGLTDHDIMLTCQANKDNYTIAFEGSLALCSEADSDYHEPVESDVGGSSDSHHRWQHRPQLGRQPAMDQSMARSDSLYTTWSKLHKRSSDVQLTRHPSGNNNTAPAMPTSTATGAALKSRSLPDLCPPRRGAHSGGRCVRLYDVGEGDLSLVRLFMRQRTGSSIATDSCSQSESGASGSNHRCSLNDCSVCCYNNNRSNNIISGSTDAIRSVADNGNRNTECIKAADPRVDNWVRVGNVTGGDEYSTCCFEDSLVGPPVKDGTVHQQQQPELIREETEESESSSSVEQLSESVSKLEEYVPVSLPVQIPPALDHIRCHDNNNGSRALEERATQTSVVQSRNVAAGTPPSPRTLSRAVQTLAEHKRRTWVLFPNYTLPDLAFLRKHRHRELDFLLAPQKVDTAATVAVGTTGGKRRPRPLSCDDVEVLRRKGFAHVRDRDSLAVLLPREYRRLLEEPDTNKAVTSDSSSHPSSGFRGSSTLLSDSNPLLVYRYESECSVQQQLQQHKKKAEGKVSPPALSKRGILRQQQKEDGTGRHHRHRHHRHHHQRKPPPPPLDPDKDLCDDEEDFDEGVDAGTDSSYEEPRPPTPPLPRSAAADAVLGLDGLLDVSGLSSVLGSAENLEGWGDDDMKRLRMQVSKFLCGQRSNVMADVCNGGAPHNTPEHRHLQGGVGVGAAGAPRGSGGSCDCSGGSASSSGRSSSGSNSGRKTVSFRLSLPTPPNSPSAALQHQQRLCQGKLADNESSPCEKAVRPASLLTHVHSPSVPLAAIDIAQKRELVTAVGDAVEQVVSHFSAAENRQHCCTLGDSVRTPAVARIALGKLCPALYAALCDGLRPELDTAFGPIPNSLWQVVEASAQKDPMTKSLNELVLRINSEDVFTEGIMKFNAFVLGLLNVRSLDAWVGYLRTRESVLRRYYQEECGLLPLGNLGGPAWRGLADQLVACLQPLALLPFRLDLLHQPRQLAARLSLSPPAETPRPARGPARVGAAAAAGIPAGAPGWSLRGLVRSIHSSLSQPSPRQGGGEEESQLPDVVGSSQAWENSTQRPRSCVDTATAPNGLTSLTDLASTVRKRWSGIQLGSRLFQAFDRLGAEDDSDPDVDTDDVEVDENVARPEPDSLEPQEKQPPTTRGQQATADARPATAAAERGAVGQPAGSSPQPAAAGGKFRRLQMKWELLSNKEPSLSPQSGGSSKTTSPSESSPSCVSSNHSSSSGGPAASPGGRAGAGSRIPRPVASPTRQQPSGIPVLSPAAARVPNGIVTRRSSSVTPASSRRVSAPPSTPVSAKTSPPAPAEATENGTVAGAGKRGIPRPSRVDRVSSGAPAPRPSSLPYGQTGAARGGGTRQQQRRPVSVSAGRTAGTGATGASTSPRFVRTLCHRLPSDAGHLAFNEGERLRVVLDVDDSWLLCCRGDQKGLVPRSAVV